MSAAFGLRRSLPTRALAPAVSVVVATAVALVLALTALPAEARAADPEVGTIEVFRAYDWGADQTVYVAGVVEYVGTEVVIYVEKGRPVPDAFVSGLGHVFDQEVFPRLTGLLGGVPDPGIDGESRVVILLYDFNDSGTDGYFDSDDVDPVAPDSNRREIFALNLEALMPEVDQAAAAAAHELAHLILYYQDYMLDPSPGRRYEGDREVAPWVEEALAVYAELASGYPSRAEGYLQSFAIMSNEDLTDWHGNRNDYGASYAFGVYLAERFGEDFITDLAAEPLDGVAGIEAVLGRRGAFDTFASIFDDWVVANLLDGRPPAASLLSYSGIDFLTELTAVADPLPRVGTVSVANHGAVYLDLPPTATTSVVRAVLDGEDGAPLHAALVSWDSAGVIPPTVTPMPLATGTAGGQATSPTGYDRHTLAVWARGVPGPADPYSATYSLAVDPATDIQFLDVSSDHVFFVYIDDLLTRGVISGKETPPGSGLWYFRSGDSVLRAQFAKMVVEAVGLHTEPVERLDAPSFPDVPPRYDLSGEPLPYPFDYVEEAAAAGIVGGFTDGRFGPWEPIKRIQLVRMIIKAAAAAGHPFAPYTGSATVFADIRPGNPDYWYAMTAYSNGIVDGSTVDPKTGLRWFYPWNKANRGQVAKMTANLIWGLESVALGDDPGIPSSAAPAAVELP